MRVRSGWKYCSLGLCLVMGFGVNGVEPLGSVTVVFFNYLMFFFFFLVRVLPYINQPGIHPVR
jgi:hypothetical protein